MEKNIILYLENKLEDLRFELSLSEDDTVKSKVVKDINDTFQILKYFKNLELEQEEFIPWKHIY